MTERHELDAALLRWLEAKLANSNADSDHEDALNYLIGLVLSEADSTDVKVLRR